MIIIIAGLLCAFISAIHSDVNLPTLSTYNGSGYLQISEGGYSKKIATYIIALLEQRSQCTRPYIFCSASFLTDKYLISIRMCASTIALGYTNKDRTKYPGYGVRISPMSDPNSGRIRSIENVYSPRDDSKDFGIIELEEPVEFYIPTRIELVPVFYNRNVSSQGFWLNYTEDETFKGVFIKSTLRVVEEEKCILKPNQVCVELNVSEGNYLPMPGAPLLFEGKLMAISSGREQRKLGVPFCPYVQLYEHDKIIHKILEKRVKTGPYRTYETRRNSKKATLD